MATPNPQGNVERAPAVAGCDQVQARFDAWQARGYVGERAPGPHVGADVVVTADELNNRNAARYLAIRSGRGKA